MTSDSSLVNKFRNTALAFAAMAAVGCGKKEAEPIEPTPADENAEVSAESQEDVEPTAPEPTPESADGASADPDAAGEGARSQTGRNGRERVGRRRPGDGGVRPGMMDGGEVVREPGMRPTPVGRKPTPGMGEPGGDVPGADPGVAGDPTVVPGPGDPLAAPGDGAMPGGPGDAGGPVAQGGPTVPTPSDSGREPSARTAPEPPVQAPDAEKLLPVATVMENVKTKKLTPAGALPGIAIQPGYTSTFFAAADGKSLGVSLQAWQDPMRRESDDRFRRMRLQYPNAEDVAAMAPAKAFYAHFKGVQMLTFVDSVKRVVASVACGENVCDHEQLLKLARSVRERL